MTPPPPSTDPPAAAATAPLPPAPPQPVAPNIVLQPPLSRRGTGPGLVLVVGAHLPLDGSDVTLDPPPLLKWAEEGFAVVQVALRDGDGFEGDFGRAVEALVGLGECTVGEGEGEGGLGVVAYVPLPTPAYKTLNAATNPSIAAIINYSATPVPAAATSIQTLWHAPDQTSAPTADTTATATTAITHVYPAAPPNFTLPAHPAYRSGPAALAHTRSLAFVKPLLGGPSFDLEAIWNEHCAYEFGERAVDKTMATMVREPYVNHIPTVTGGVGRERLTHFYRNHFVHSNPPDTSLELVSRTVGVDRVIDEFVFRCTHDRVVDWLVPGVPPTGKPLEVPFTSVVNIRGDRLYHEHIAWDQATLLRQLGLLPEYLPFPYLVDGKGPAPGKKFEYCVPVAGVETARKLVDENSVQSNEMFSYGIREVDA